MFQPAVPVAKVLEAVHSRTYVLPAIQREFVWDTDQICRLFDSLMREYPLGAFLFWIVDPDLAKRFTFYDFITDYHEKEAPYAPVAHVPAGKGVTAVLDGQQRLTGLNIGLYGTHAERQPRKRWSNPDAFPKRQLYLNLLGEVDSDELGMEFDLQFLTPKDVERDADQPKKWYRVRDVLELKDSGPAIMSALEQRGLEGSKPFNVLYTLYRGVRETPTVNAYHEESQDPNKVLDIFVRVNSAGTPLSYSDLLLSMATNQWQELDAREEVRSLVSELNGLPAGFSFTKNLVLKTGLVLVEVPDIKFRVSNFTQSNMALMEKNWVEIRSKLLTTAGLLASFGFSGRTLTAESVAIPIAYYLFRRGLGPNYVESAAHANDRLAIRGWVTRSLMKRGIWGSGLDTLLTRLRDAIRNGPASGFPVQALERTMAAIGKPLQFTEAEIAELLDLRFGSARVFPVLATLYPGLDLTKTFHEDHIFPKSRFTPAKLKKAGIDPELIDELIQKADGLPNLQLLAGLPNIEKQAALPSEWLDGPQFPTAEARATYVNENDLQELPKGLDEFLDFFSRRRERIEGRLRTALGVLGSATEGE